MKIKHLLLVLLSTVFCQLSSFAQAKADTVYVYDTIRITIKRPQPQTVFFEDEEKSATFSQDSIKEDVNTKETSSIMSTIKQKANRFIQSFAVGSLAILSNIQSTALASSSSGADFNFRDLDSVFMKTDTASFDTAEDYEFNKAGSTLEKTTNFTDHQANKQNDFSSADSLDLPENDGENTISDFNDNRDTIIKNITHIDAVTENEDEISEDKKPFPLYISFMHPIGMFGRASEDYTYNLAFSVFTGAIGGLNGIQFGGFYNQISGPGTGIQMAGLINVSKAFRGIQFAGISNFTNNSEGIQVAGISNISNDIKGIQYAGIMNAADKVQGIQVSGVINISKDLKGIQTSGILNSADHVRGIQASGLYNKAESIDGLQTSFINHVGELKGLQVGFINTAKKAKGTQIAFINITDSLESGFPIAFINIIKNDRFFEIFANADIYNSYHVGFSFGSNKIHTILDIGHNTASKDQSNVEARIGLGNNTKLFKNLYLKTNILSSTIWGKDEGVVLNSELKCGLVYYFWDRIGISVTPSIYHTNDANAYKYYKTIANIQSPFGTIGGVGFNMNVALSVKL